MDKGCPPQKIKFTKDVKVADAGNTNADYILGSNDDFVPGGWLICINSTNEPCVYVTDGQTVDGVSLNPLRCEDYK